VLVVVVAEKKRRLRSNRIRYLTLKHTCRSGRRAGCRRRSRRACYRRGSGSNCRSRCSSNRCCSFRS
jgi:hypothetical protein